MKVILTAILVIFMGQFAYSANHETVDTMVEEILREVVDQAVKDGKRIVKENTGIDLFERGYGEDYEKHSKDHETSKSKHKEKGKDQDEIIRELNQLSREHDREIIKLEDELNRKLSKARHEFARELEKEDKPEKIMEKREKLKEKVNKAYAKFDRKVSEENQRFDKKREKMLDKLDL